MASRTTINLLVNYSVEPKKQGSSGGAWDWGGREPVEAGEEPAGAVELGDADEEGEQAGWGEAGGCDGENPIEAFDRAQGDDLGGGRGEVFGAPGENIDVGQCKGADDFAKKGDLLLPGLHERNARRREADLDGQAGEAGAGADVKKADRRVLAAGGVAVGWSLAARRLRGRGDAGSGVKHPGSGEQALGEEQGFAEVAGDDFFGAADGGEIDAPVPVEQ